MAATPDNPDHGQPMLPEQVPVTSVPRLESEQARCWQRWSARWDHFQENYVLYREQQFNLMLDYVAQGYSSRPLQVLDLACGPGCLGGRLLRRLPEAEVVNLDFDPWLLEMGRQTIDGYGRIRWVEADLRTDEWVAQLPYSAFHVVLSSTALHWFEREELLRIYRHLAAILVEGGWFLNADVIPTGSPGVQRLTRTMLIRWQARELAKPDREGWPAFWREAHQEPTFQELLRERERRLGLRKPRRFLPLEFHQEALSSAGFADVGEIWRCHENAIILAIR